jgi:serine/threonine protein kinase
MPPPLPTRYQLEQRLGRDGDIEEWLATDTSLDRPVLIRVLGPETDDHRREQFLEAMRAVAAVPHMHLTSVYAAAPVRDGAYSVTEWTGGVTMQDRLDAGEPLTPAEFVTNAAGLASALAALHESAVLHGSIDPSAIRFSSAHPAKLGAFGRTPVATSRAEDVEALARTLHACLTGNLSMAAPASQLVDGLSPMIDRSLEDARAGALDARGLAAALQGAPSVAEPTRRSGWTWRWLTPAFILLAVAGALIALGTLLSSGSDSPALFPARPPTSTTSPALIPTASTTTSTTPPSAFSLEGVFVYDPYGDESEHDQDVALLTDGDVTTSWRTERYFDPLPLIKPGVGVVFAVTGTPASFRAWEVSDGTTYSLMWASSVPQDPDGWTRIAGGTVSGESISLQLPPRDGGFWLLWLTELPQQEDGYFTSIGEVRFAQ